MRKEHQEKLAEFEAKRSELDTILAKEDFGAEDATKAEELKKACQGLAEQIKVYVQQSNLMGDADNFRKMLGDPVLTTPAAGKGGAEVLGYLDRSTKAEVEMKAGMVTDSAIPEEMALTAKQLKTIRDPDYLRAFNLYFKNVHRLKFFKDTAEFKVMQEGIDDQGGFLVPAEIQDRLLVKKPTPTRLRQYVTQLRTTRDRLELPKVNYTTDDLYTTGVRATYSGEVPSTATVHRVTEPVWGRFAVDIYTAMLSMPLTNDIVQDALFDVAGFVTQRFFETGELLTDNMILNGSGIGQPHGILENPNGANEPAQVVSGSAALLTADGLISLAYAVPEQYDDNCRFVFNKTSTAKNIRGLKDSSNRYLWGEGLQDSGLAAPIRPSNLLGYPYAFCGFAPNEAANAYPVVFGDFQGYFWIERMAMSIRVLEELYAETNQLLVLGKLRHGGDVGEDWRLKIQKCST